MERPAPNRGTPCEAACRRGKIPITDDEGRIHGRDKPIAIRSLKCFACERNGAEAHDSAAMLEAAQGCVREAGSDADEMAALLCAFLRGGSRPAQGERVAIIGACPRDSPPPTIWR